MEAVAFDAMGVLYKGTDDMRGLVTPFAHSHGSRLSDREIRLAYRRAMLGELTADQLWSALGVAGVPQDLNREYLNGYELVPGIRELLDELRDQGLVLGCISNDVAEWSVARRALHGLDQRIGFWTISSEVHARKPDEPIFRAFLKTVGIASKRVAFVDDRQVNIAAAEALGFKTILVDFAAAGNDPRAIRSVDQLGEALAELRATD